MEKEKIKDFTAKVFDDLSGAMASGLAYIGVRTGLFRVMSGRGPMTLYDVVRESGLQSRYVEEWLNGMVCAKYLKYHPMSRSFELPEEHAFMVASDGTDHFVGGLFYSIPMMLGVAPRVAQAFVEGGGVPFKDYGEDGIEAIDLMNRGLYEQRFASYWLKSVPGVYDQLVSGGRVLDFGCGTGRVTLALANAFRNSEFVGLDSDPGSIRQAKEYAEEVDQEDRVRFVCQLVDDFAKNQKFDLITACDCVHDLIDPSGVLTALKDLLNPTGTLFVIEPKVADRLEDNINPIGSLYYGMSVFHCMTQSLADGGAGLGTCMGPARLEALVNSAGFTRFEALEIKSQTTSFYSIGH
jgi:2-polyprenyl-3-methyl-5-hydroxy-6-metoxy-1,4-benzoquinol methylase